MSPLADPNPHLVREEKDGNKLSTVPDKLWAQRQRERAKVFWQPLKLPERRLDSQSSLLRRRHFRSSLRARVSSAVSY